MLSGSFDSDWLTARYQQVCLSGLTLLGDITLSVDGRLKYIDSLKLTRLFDTGNYYEAIDTTYTHTLGGAILFLLIGSAQAALCPAVTVADSKGMVSGAFPQQYELSEFQSLANCALSFNAHPKMADYNARIRGNPALPTVESRWWSRPKELPTLISIWWTPQGISSLISMSKTRFTSNDNEVRILKLVTGETDYKSQSVQLSAAPLLLDNRDSGDYQVDLRPDIIVPSFSFNVTSTDAEKRKVFGDLRFR